MTSLSLAPARGELRVALLTRLARDGVEAASISELGQAVDEIDAADPGVPVERIVAARARHAARTLATRLGLETSRTLPAWMLADLPDRLIALANTLGNAPDWTAVEHALTEYGPAELTLPQTRQSTQALIALYPDHRGPRLLGDVQHAISEIGFEAMVDQQRRRQALQALVAGWISTWAESRSYFDAHQGELASQSVVDLLGSTDDDTAQAHRAILTLAAGLDVDAAYTIVADVGAAADAAEDAIETGRPELLPVIYATRPDLARATATDRGHGRPAEPRRSGAHRSRQQSRDHRSRRPKQRHQR